MKTREQIVAQLLDEKKITAQEAVTLFMAQKEYVYLPYQQPYYYPTNPFDYHQPYRVTCAAAHTNLIVNSN